MLYIWTDETEDIELSFTSKTKEEREWLLENKKVVLNPIEVMAEHDTELLIGESQLEILSCIDNAKYLDNKNVMTEFGETDVLHLSTTCLTLLILSTKLWGTHSNRVLDLGGISSKGLEEVMDMAKSTDIHVYLDNPNSSFEDTRAYVNGELLEGKLIGFRISLESREKYKRRYKVYEGTKA